MSDAINEVKPFIAEHYNAEKVGEWGSCLSRPYDVISPEDQDNYYKRHPFNVVRLILNKIEAGDTEANNRYTRAREFLAEWRKQGVIVSTQRPSYWLLEEEFEAEGIPRRCVSGFIGLVRLQDYAAGRILPHENVIREPLEDRIRLTRATHTQFEYIWGVYPDSQGAVESILTGVDCGDAVLDYTGPTTQVRHRLWRLVDEKACGTLQREMSKQKIYIADGHHRYQTMLTIRDEMRKLHPDAGPDAPWEFIMMFLVSMRHPGLTTLPTHRMLKSAPPLTGEVLKKAESLGFQVRQYSYAPENELEARETWLRELRQVSPHERKFGLAVRKAGSYYLFTIPEKQAAKLVDGEAGSSTLRLLDVSLLNSVVFRRLLDLTDEQMKPQGNVFYTPRVQIALDRVHAGDMDSAWFLNRTSSEDILTVADCGEKMPQKSTHFYPKPLSGLVFFNMNGAT